MKNAYNRGLAWGKKIFRKQVNDYGEKGLYKADKAATTCNKYASGSAKVTKTGKKINSQMRLFYKGARDGLQSAYNDFYK